MSETPVLYAALNWGMGHASRSVPLIRALKEAGIPVILASDGVAAELLKAEFPEDQIIQLPSYKVSYPTRNIYLNVLLSVFSILGAIRKERRWLRDYLRTHSLRAVITDNRYGLRTKQVPCFLVTHQLHFAGNWAWANHVGEWAVRWWTRRFSEIWVPDWPGDRSLSGGMASWNYSDPPVLMIGPLSRFPVDPRNNRNPDTDIIAILSGPEPQRTQFEDLIRYQLAHIPGQHILVRGTRDPYPSAEDSKSLKVIDLLPAEDLQRLVANARMQVSRSGYSTVMDLVYSGIPALMVPTPGQIEQEFLALHLEGKGPWTFQAQDHLDLQQAWASFSSWSVQRMERPTGHEAREAIHGFIQRWRLVQDQSTV